MSTDIGSKCVNLCQNSSPTLPQVGWFKDSEMAEALGMQAMRLRTLMKKHGIPHKKLGNCVFIRAELFWEYCPTGTPGKDGDEKENT